MIRAIGLFSLALLTAQSAPGDMVPPPGGLQMQQGYQHRRRIPTIDTRRGVIWKDGGPRIDYEIDFNGLTIRGFDAPGASTIWKTSVTPINGAPRTIVFDDNADSVVMTSGEYVRFWATNVKSRRDLAEVLLMMMTYNL